MSKVICLLKNLPNIGLEKNDIGILKEFGKFESKVLFLKNKTIFDINNSYFKTIDPNLYGDSHDEKICNICHRLLTIDNFKLNQTAKDNRPVRRPSCVDCRKVIDGVSMNLLDKKEWEKIKPNYIEFECPICRKITIPGLTSKVVLNHSHLTGEITGWICDSCNTGLGRFKDSINILQNAIDYLDKTCYTKSSEADAHFLGRVRSGIYKRIFTKTHSKS